MASNVIHHRQSEMYQDMLSTPGEAIQPFPGLVTSHKPQLTTVISLNFEEERRTSLGFLFISRVKLTFAVDYPF
jgi:hypothetical protein